MSDEFAVRLKDVAKMYRVYDKRNDRLTDALGLSRFMPKARRPAAREFWALRGVDLELRKGERIGIIGRNGAGKSTLLKLITQNVAATEGTVEVNGQVQALLAAGAGFHQEFTGDENVRASLTYQGMSPDEIDEAIVDIAEFTELGDFLYQPFRTYSAGMQARLSFATATATRPETLIVDELLSAGDAYFAGRATERMQGLVESGASILIVSHSLDQVTMFCDQAIWLDRGRIAMRGPSLDVVKAYDRFTRRIEERRLQARNRKLRSGGKAQAEEESVTLRLTTSGGSSGCDLSVVELREAGTIVETLRLGDAQDADTSHSAWVSLNDGDWSKPMAEDQRRWRSLMSTEDGVSARGRVGLRVPTPDPDASLELSLVLRTNDAAGVGVELWREEELVRRAQIQDTGGEWRTERLDLRAMFHVGGGDVRPEDVSTGASHWPGEGSLRIDDVRLTDGAGDEKAIFSPGEHLIVRPVIRAQRAGEFPLIAATSLYRLDGLLVSTNISDLMTLVLKDGESTALLVDFGALNLHKGKYVFSLALFSSLEGSELANPYDLVDRSYEFEIWDDDVYRNGIFRHPAQWSVDPS